MILAGVLLLVSCAGMLLLALRKGMVRECTYTLAALLVLVMGTRITFAVGWWGLVFFPLTFLATGWVLLRGAQA